MKRFLTLLLALTVLTSLFAFSTVGEAADDLPDEDMNIIGYQVSAKPTSSDANDNYYAIRVVAAHNNVDGYFSFGYGVTVSYTEGGTEQTKTLSKPIMSNTVYKTLYAKNGETIDLSPYNAEYFSAVEITDIPVSAGDLTVTVTPIVEYDDETVNGAPKAFTHDFTTLTTMTFNINNWEESDAHLTRIKAVIKDADKGNYPDVIGFQEMSDGSGYEWVTRLMADPEIAATYASFGESCGDSTGEQCTIFYNKNKFDLVEENSGTRWLWCEHGVDCALESCANGSETAGNFTASDTTTYYRIMTYATLRCKDDPAKEFAFINTHLDLCSYLRGSYGEGAVQNKQIEYVLNFAKTFEEDTPVILVGDFNARDEAFGSLSVTPGSTVLQDIVDAGFVRTEKATPEVRTFGGEIAGEYYDGDLMSPGIDHIFVRAQNLYCLTYTFCDEKIDVNGALDYPSDHIPRIAEYAIW